MRVAFVIDGLGRGGGVEGYLRRAAHYLVAAGDEVELVLGYGSAVGPWRVRTLLPQVRGRAARLRAFASAHAQWARSARCDSSLAIRHVYAAHVYQPHGGLIDAAARARDRLLGYPGHAALRRAYRKISPRARVMRRLEAAALARSRLILALSSRVFEEIAAAAPDARAKTHLHELGVDLEAYAPDGPRARHPQLDALPATTPLVLFAAYNLRLKGLIEAARTLLTDPRLHAVHLAIAGPTAPQVLPRSMRRGLAERIHWLGPQTEMAALYRRADALLHPTWYDPCSTVALEALACGCPVVTTRANGAASLQGEALRVADEARDARGLADGLSHLIAGGARIRELARATVEGRAERAHFAALREHLSVAAGPLHFP